MPHDLPFLRTAPHGLSQEQEQSLAGIISNGAEEQEKIEAVHQLVEGNVRFAVYFVLKLMRMNHIDGKKEDDLVGEGFLALTRSAWAFRPGRVKFNSFASVAIRRAVFAMMNQTGFTIPDHMHSAIERYEHHREKERLTTFDEMEQAGIVEKVFAEMAETHPSLSRKNFPQNLKRALHLFKAETQPLAEERQE